jgi:hypothetical protein
MGAAGFIHAEAGCMVPGTNRICRVTIISINVKTVKNLAFIGTTSCLPLLKRMPTIPPHEED